jgi:hypothetical protein
VRFRGYFFEAKRGPLEKGLGNADLGCIHTNRVGSSPIQSIQTLESRGVHTDRVESNQVFASSGWFLYSLNSEQLKNSKAMENFNMRVLHTVMWRRRWRRKRRNLWVHPINIKRPEIGKIPGGTASTWHDIVTIIQVAPRCNEKVHTSSESTRGSKHLAAET